MRKHICVDEILFDQFIKSDGKTHNDKLTDLLYGKAHDELTNRLTDIDKCLAQLEDKVDTISKRIDSNKIPH